LNASETREQDLATRLTTMTASQNHNTATISSLEPEVSTLKTEAAANKSEADNYREAYVQSKRRDEKIRRQAMSPDKTAHFGEQLAQKDRDIHNLRQNANRYKEERDTARENHIKSHEGWKVYEQNVKEDIQRWQEWKITQDKQREELKKQNKRLTKEVSDLRGKIETIAAELQEAEKSTEDLMEEKVELGKQIADLLETQEESHVERETFNNKIDDLESESEKTINEMGEARITIESQAEELEKLQLDSVVQKGSLPSATPTDMTTSHKPIRKDRSLSVSDLSSQPSSIVLLERYPVGTTSSDNAIQSSSSEIDSNEDITFIAVDTEQSEDEDEEKTPSFAETVRGEERLFDDEGPGLEDGETFEDESGGHKTDAAVSAMSSEDLIEQ
jgi:chromosome segregation ATPase